MTTILLRRATAAEWTSANPVLASGEVGVEKDSGKHKIGDGLSDWSTLDYFLPESELHTLFAAANDVTDLTAAVSALQVQIADAQGLFRGEWSSAPEDPYMLGEYVVDDGLLYRSTVDDNTSNPGTDGNWSSIALAYESVAGAQAKADAAVEEAKAYTDAQIEMSQIVPPPTFVGISTNIAGTNNGLNSRTVPGHQEGDLLIAVIQSDASPITHPGDWTPLYSRDRNGPPWFFGLYIYWKIGSGAEPDFTFNASTVSGASTAIVAYRGSSFVEYLADSMSSDSTSVDPGDENLIVYAIPGQYGLTPPAITVPPEVVSRAQVNGTYARLLMADETQVSGSTPVRTFTNAGSVATLALYPEKPSKSLVYAGDWADGAYSEGNVVRNEDHIFVARVDTSEEPLPPGLAYEEYFLQKPLDSRWVYSSLGEVTLISDFTGWPTPPANVERALRINPSAGSINNDVTLTINFSSAGTISFDENAWGEFYGGPTYDGGQFYIDDVMMYTAPDRVWSHREYPLAAGIHKFKWRFFRDSGSSAPEGYLVANLVTTGTEVVPVDWDEIGVVSSVVDAAVSESNAYADNKIAALTKVLLIENGATVPPETPVGTIIFEKGA